MNGAHSLINSLVDSGVEVCFANPGTSEMHFVAALDDVAGMRGVLALFEGVATGAADGYARIAGKPAATLLHLGPGLGNGWANLHNARRAHTPVVNIVGDHALTHKRFDAPLESDITAIAHTVSGWVKSSTSSDDVGRDAAECVAASRTGRGQIATLILPADVSWSDSGMGPARPKSVPALAEPSERRVGEIAIALRETSAAALLIGGRAVASERGLVAAARVAEATGAKLICETFPARLRRGAGLPALDRLAYLAEFAEMQLAGIEHLVLVDTRSPVSFFAYPGRPSDLVPAGCSLHYLDDATIDSVRALEALADTLGAPGAVMVVEPARPPLPVGELTASAVSQSLAHQLPANAIISDEGNTAGIFLAGETAGCEPHDVLTLSGGSVGQGMPVATGAAVAAPDRKVINLEADGSALYTIQALWTQARENLDVTTVLLNNGCYAVLNLELSRVGALEPGPQALGMLNLTDPTTNFCAVANGFGVPARRATTAEEFNKALAWALAVPGPALVEAMLPPAL